MPVYNEEHIIDELYSRTAAALNGITQDWEVICVNDGSTDTTLGKLLSLNEKDSRWKIIDLSRNFGQQRAIWAGLNHAAGDYIGIMDADLQDAPQHFADFYEELKGETDVVYAVRTGRKENRMKKVAYWTFYRLLKNVFEVNIPIDSGDFCLMRRAVVRHMLTMPEQSLFVRGIRNWVGFRQKGIRCERDVRFAGAPKYSLRGLVKLAYNGIFSFSDFPLRFLGRLGLYIIICSIFYAAWILTKKFLWGTVPEGFTTIILVILFFGGVQLVTIRILGEYIHRIYDESRKRPLFIVREKYGL
ncbi:MAG TPA: glycosyltransferase family 2 protein [Flavisolibacter sp.]